MEIKPFKTTISGDVLITNHTPLRPNDNLRLMVIPSMSETEISAKELEVYNPYDMRVVTATIPEFDQSKIVYFDIKTPSAWIIGKYQALVRDGQGKIIANCNFLFEPNSNALYIQRTLAPKWFLNYSLKVQNKSEKPIGNFVAFVALPLTISPQQIVKDLKIYPENLKLATDVEGNHWTRFEIARISPKEERNFSYSALVESYPLLISRELSSVDGNNPYDRKFLATYLRPEPHIESDHSEIVKLATKLSHPNPLTFAKRAAQEVQKILHYEIQDAEYGAAYAIEHKKGDCTEYAALFVALCRAEGIPARTNAGFALIREWERHATAEFLVGGRWIPLDLTMRRGSEILFGNLPTNIVVSRGNWMGGTLTKEVSYKYQVIDRAQKLDVLISWQIVPEENSTNTNIKANNKPIKILEFDELFSTKINPTIIDSKKIRILDDTKTKTQPKEIIKLSEKKKVVSNYKQKDLEVEIQLPDVISKEKITKSKLTIKNNSEKPLQGSFEIREQNDEVIRILMIKSVTIAPFQQISFSSKLQLNIPGKYDLDFILTNRIGRVLVKKVKAISVY